MKLDKFREFMSINESKSEIDSLCKEYRIKNYTINDDLTLDFNGSVYLVNEGLRKLPLKFRKVSGDFYCSNNQLTSLEGCPKEVGGNFDCSHNQLTSLEGSPPKAGGNFVCRFNQLTSLEGSPKVVGGGFYCDFNKLTNLEGSPKEVGGYFSCSDNKLTSLEGSPRKVGDIFYCSYNKLKDVNGFTEKFYGDKLYISNNPVEEVFKIFPKEKWIELPEILNGFEVIDSKRGRVYSMGLKLCFEDLGLEVPQNLDEIKLVNYEIR